MLFALTVEVLFKRHFWVVHLLFMLGVAWLITRTANAFIEVSLLPLPTGQSKRAAPIQKPTAMTSLNLERVAKALGLPVPKPELVVNEPTQPQIDLNAAPVRTTLRLKLLGTLVSDSTPEWSVASIQDVVTLKTATYMPGDKIQTAEVLEIERERVIILNNSRKEFIDGSGEAGAPPPPIAVNTPVREAAPPSVALGTGVKQIGENDYEIPRAEIDKTLANLNDVAMQARIVPAFKDGVAQGFKLFSIRPDSIYSKIGIQNGDVIKRINGFDLNSPEKALEVYSKLKESGRIDIEVERNGAAVRKTYNVK
ncbi:MAG: type II secretion system protein GspC [Archangium sp.]